MTYIDEPLANKLDLEAQDKDNARHWQQEADIQSARRGGKPFEYFTIKNAAGTVPADAFLQELIETGDFSAAREAAYKANGEKDLYN